MKLTTFKKLAIDFLLHKDNGFNRMKVFCTLVMVYFIFRGLW